MIEDLGSDPLDGAIDKSGWAGSTATTKVRESSGDGFPVGFVGGMSNVVGVTDMLA